MTIDTKKLLDRCERYLLEEPCDALLSEIKTLIADGSQEAMSELSDRMSQNLAFGTAGLRGKMEAGYNRMNKVLVFRFAYAFGLAVHNDMQSNKRVVLGYDGRNNSRDFADEISAILRSMGLTVLMFDHAQPTPLVAYAAKFLHATASVMVTASHNPAQDNGIKIYQGSSAQAQGKILADIERYMNEAPSRTDFYDENVKDLGEKNHLSIGDEVVKNYLREIKATQFFPDQFQERKIKIAYTPLHGMGKNIFLAAAHDEGYHNIAVVPEQSEPDGNFPTVLFPNPEEAGTLDLVHQLAKDEHCDFVVANDPDADRLQISCSDHEGVLTKLSGNEMGAIFGYFSLLRAAENKITPILASSIVSSRMLKVMCEKMAGIYVDGLTGFSNIVQAAMNKKSEMKNKTKFIFAYEEAIGFLIGSIVLDKDGMHAGVRFMEIMNYLQENKKSIWHLLDELYLKFGLFVNSSWSWRFDGTESVIAMRKTMEKVRTIDPKLVAQMLGQSECVKYDLLEPQENNCYAGLRSNVVIFSVENSGRIIVRPSGTEPKIKFYVELWDHVGDHKMLTMMKAKLTKAIAQLKGDSESLFGKGT